MGESPVNPPPSEGGRTASFATSRRLRWPRIVAALVIGIAVGVSAWLLLSGPGGEDRPRRVTGVILSAKRLRAFADRLDRQIYWASERPPGAYGERPSYEFSRTRDGKFYVRYLPRGVLAGDRRPAFLTVGTYPDARASSTIRTALRRPGASRVPLPRRGHGVVHDSRPQSVFLSSSDGDELIEVYDPDPRRARQLVTEGRIGLVR